MKLFKSKRRVKCSLGDPSFIRDRGTLFKEESNLLRICKSSSLNLHTCHLINTVFWCQISSVSMASRPPTIDKTSLFIRRRCDHDVTIQLHESSQPITRCKAWQSRAGNAVDRFWDCLSWRCNGCCMAKSYRQKILHSNWGHPSTIVSPSCSWRHQDTRWEQFFLK